MRITKYSLELPNNLVKEVSTNYTTETRLNSSEAIVSMMNLVFNANQKAEEYVYMIAFNTKMCVLGVFEISHGAVNYSVLSPREIFIRAALIGAVNIVLCHNHPSGDPTPSKEDCRVTRQIKDAGNIMGIKLLDHIIIGNGYYSFQEKGEL